jgi:hypothetical protein
MRSVRHPDCAAYPEATLREVQGISVFPSNSIGLLPDDVRGVYAALKNEVFKE